MSYLHVGKYQNNNYYQSMERTRGNVVQKMMKMIKQLQLWFSHSKLQEIIEIQIYLIYSARYFLWKHNTFLAICCTLLSNSYFAIYLQKTTTQKTEKKERRNKEFGGTRTQTFCSTRLHQTTAPQRLITQSSGKVFHFIPFP